MDMPGAMRLQQSQADTHLDVVLLKEHGLTKDNHPLCFQEHLMKWRWQIQLCESSRPKLVRNKSQPVFWAWP